MAEIVLKTNQPGEASELVKEMISIETNRVNHSLAVAKRRLLRFESKYKITSDTFISDWTAEDLEGKDMEYVEWAGEYQLMQRLMERLQTLNTLTL